MSSLFISYSHSDKVFAKKLAADLRDSGHIVWIDEFEVLVGDSLVDMISDAIESVEFIVAIISNASIESPWVKRELDLALNREIRERRVVVLPILLDDVELPGFLKGKFYADFRLDHDYKEGLRKLLEKLGPRSEALPLSYDEIALKPYLFIVTSRHGYLRVPKSEIEELHIKDKITDYSYRDEHYLYLEEDCDLVTFVEAKEKKHGEDYDFEKDTFFVYVEEFPS